jgi:hypothetical protein
VGNRFVLWFWFIALVGIGAEGMRNLGGDGDRLFWAATVAGFGWFLGYIAAAR